MAELLAIDVGGVNPIDERPPATFVHRSRCADDKDRAAIEIGVVDAHGRMQHADHVMHDRHHRLASRLGVAVRDLHGDFLMLTQQKRRFVTAVIDQRIVQSAVARSRIERDIRKTILLDQIDNDVGLPCLLGITRRGLRVGGVVHRG